MCSKVLNGHIILTDTSITTILAPEMTYTPKKSCKIRILRTDSHFRPTAKSGRATASKLLRQTKNKGGMKYTIYKYDLFPDERTNHFGNSRLALQLSALKNITDALRNSRYLRPEIGEAVLPAPPYPGNPVRPGPPTRTLPR